MPEIVEPVVADPALAEAQAAVDAAEAARIAAEATPLEPVVTDPAIPVEPVQPVVPEKYDLKVPDGSTLDAAFVERTAATARALGLTNEAGQQLLDGIAAELSTAVTPAVEAGVLARMDALKPGGAEWLTVNEAHKAASLADPDLGAGDPAKLEVIRGKAQQALTKYFPDVTQDQLEASLLASNPLFLKGLARIGEAMSEGALVLGVPVVPAKKLAMGLYENDGKGPITEPATK